MPTNNPVTHTIDALAKGTVPEDDALLALLACDSLEKNQYLQERADILRRQTFGNHVYIRGLIEFTNYCKNDCYYCGIRKGCKSVTRYRLTPEEILQCCKNGYELGFRTFVLQGGEDPYWNDDRLASLVEAIRAAHPDCAITLSAGERSWESYQKLFDAGADRYLLRHETADKAHYQKLHPQDLSFENRMECLQHLKQIGYQVGCGFMVGSPGQTIEHILKDLRFLVEFQPHMIGIGPFIPAAGTPFEKEYAGSADLTVKLLSIIRLLLPKALLPATTALGTASEDGRLRGICAGANVIMPNLSPASVRKNYRLYDNKIATGAESAEGILQLKKQVERIGYEIVTARGDYPDIK
ncbi:[FeFe] hydrogenase H-cluster radical SAM maturase HydE [Emergencia sp. 1XD21-10]|uniref:[FeFe] hydrogenase H-cluster radical SAM maturase HydE n=1 Tax=Emergencia sp. 1XD21-10 TaxID=2304569 RepID=UPI0013795E0C|nr:[FeFe] hydrogenase H-cluster radical SAM maturase HydE [Emergencia sp. 1XD21-10]NCE99902.1 [FeFe] hydrogenase H-cluster radical SAM maturase HydE [Emergencia sp. 1XD21-10]